MAKYTAGRWEDGRSRDPFVLPPPSAHSGGICVTAAPVGHSPRVMVRISVSEASNTCAIPGVPPEHGPLSIAYRRPLLSAATAELPGICRPWPAPRTALLLS